MSVRRPVLLVVDDEPSILRLLRDFGDRAGFEVVTCGGGSEALEYLRAQTANIAIVDLQLPEVGGLDVLRAIREADAQCQTVLMTGHATVDSAIEAIQSGAMDYLSKPLDFGRLGQLLAAVHAESDRQRAVAAADQEAARHLVCGGMIGRDPAMQELFRLIRRLAPHARTALITGETGSGKELVASALHEHGPRRGRRLVTINCAAVVETLFESELFGHMRGAFTGATENKPGLFEAADGGTVFLDEVGELPLNVQAKLLRVVEHGEIQRVGALQAKRVDVNVIAATNRDLLGESAAGRFDRISTTASTWSSCTCRRSRSAGRHPVSRGRIRPRVLGQDGKSADRRHRRRRTVADDRALARQRARASQRHRARRHARRR